MVQAILDGRKTTTRRIIKIITILLFFEFNYNKNEKKVYKSINCDEQEE